MSLVKPASGGELWHDGYMYSIFRYKIHIINSFPYNIQHTDNWLIIKNRLDGLWFVEVKMMQVFDIVACMVYPLVKGWFFIISWLTDCQDNLNPGKIVLDLYNSDLKKWLNQGNIDLIFWAWVCGLNYDDVLGDHYCCVLNIPTTLEWCTIVGIREHTKYYNTNH